jgi:hypothetical protein
VPLITGNTEGYNDPSLDLIIVARPTQSPLLLTQIVGRATRKFDGKSVADIVEIIDHHSQKTATTAKIFGFKQTFDGEGHSMLECVTHAEKLCAEKPYYNAFAADNWTEMLACFERATENNRRGLAITERPKFNFTQSEREQKPEIFHEWEPSNEYFVKRYKYFYSGNIAKLMFTDKEEGYRYVVAIFPNGLGGFDAVMKRKLVDLPKSAPGEQVVAFRGNDHLDAAGRIETYILGTFPDWDRLLNESATWKKKAAT